METPGKCTLTTPSIYVWTYLDKSINLFNTPHRKGSFYLNQTIKFDKDPHFLCIIKLLRKLNIHKIR